LVYFRVELIPTISELASYWDEYAAVFDTYWTRTSTVAALNLMNHLQLTIPSPSRELKLLEVGCGSGLGTRLCSFLKPPNVAITAIDLSQEMLKIATQRVKDPTVIFMHGNAEELPFHPEEFDRYLANFVLHLVPDPVKMLKEAHRVLKPGSIAAFSVWGRKEFGTQFTIPTTAWNKVGAPDMKRERSPFHLSDAESTRRLILQAGFRQCISWYTFIALDCLSGEEFARKVLEGPKVKHKAATLPRETTERFVSEVAAMANEILKSGQAIGYEALLLVAVK
jgi:ubiquinone/menaquinone biosynthesis C-methylase UbiE